MQELDLYKSDSFLRENDLKNDLAWARKLENEARSANTLLAYNKHWRYFNEYCLEHNLAFLPAKAEIVYLYLARIARHQSVSSVRTAKAAISYFHHKNSCISPCNHPKIKLLCHGIERQTNKKSTSATPLLYPLVKQIVDTIDVSLSTNATPSVARDKSLILFGFASGLRRSELVSLRVNDVQLCKEGARIKLNKSKTDQQGKGREIALPFNKLEQKYCPIIALKNYLKKVEISSGFIYRSFYKGQRKMRVKHLSAHGYNSLLKKWANLALITEGRISSHGLRHGFNTSAAQANASLIKMREVTGQSLQTQQCYIHAANLFEDHAVTKIYDYHHNLDPNLDEVE